MTRPVTFEHLVFPGFDREEGQLLQRELGLIEESARLFASGLCGLDVQITWSLGRSLPTRWMQAPDGTYSVHVWVDLLSPRNLPPGTVLDGRPLPRDVFARAFRNGFLHAIGRVLGSASAWRLSGAAIGDKRSVVPSTALGEVDPLERALRSHNPRRRRLPAGVRATLSERETRDALRGLFEHLEGARTDALLVGRFAGAARHLESRWDEDERLAGSPLPVEALAGLIALRLRGVDLERFLSAALTVVRAAYARVAPHLPRTAENAETGPYALAETVVYEILPVMLELGDAMPVLESGGLETPGPTSTLRGAHAGLLRFCGMGGELESGKPSAPVGSVVVELPHLGGGTALIRIDHARAKDLRPDDVLARVLAGLTGDYGRQALAAFADEAGPLRRALRVNWERRERGRYRSGKRVGIPNLRRFVVADDLRLFQRLEGPEELSYYFHVLVDVSYSMLEHHNAEKALAVAYAFASLLVELRVPVDVTLYSSGVTELFDHRSDTLRPFFGGDFGYLLSGTLEMEAIAFAVQKAERVGRRHKIMVVVTDGTPATTSLSAVGADGLADYYTRGIVPWLERAGIDLVAVGIGVLPEYHPRAVRLEDGWQTVRVFVDLLEDMVREATEGARELWA